MGKLRFFLVLSAVFLLVSQFGCCQNLSEMTEMQLIQELENQYMIQKELSQTQEQQIQDLNNRLIILSNSYQNSKKEQLKNNVLIGSVCFSTGFAAGTLIILLAN